MILADQPVLTKKIYRKDQKCFQPIVSLHHLVIMNQGRDTVQMKMFSICRLLGGGGLGAWQEGQMAKGTPSCKRPLLKKP